MCDSHISESCPMDFTSYCPVDSFRSDGETQQSVEKSLQNGSTWFMRKAKGAPHSKRLIKESGELFRDRSCSGACDVAQCHRFPSSGVKCPEFDNGHHAKSNTRSLEKASPYVSQEELNALKGCVMRSRALFSPSPSSSPVHSFVHKQPHSPRHTNS